MALNNEVVAYPGSQQLPWQTVGTIVAATGNADAALDETERDFASANVLTNCVSIEITQDISSAVIRALFLTNDADAKFDIYSMRDSGLYMARICTVTSKAGQQYAAAAGALLFADTLTLTNVNWLGAVSAIVPGTDHMARIHLDLHCVNKLLFHGYNPVDENVIIQLAGVS